MKGLESNKKSKDHGMFRTKFPGERVIRCLTLHEEDYDADDIWIEIKSAGFL